MPRVGHALATVVFWVGCGGGSSSTTTTPSNRVVAPGGVQYPAANDALGFLPLDSDLVASIDARQVHGSAIFRALEPRLMGHASAATEWAKQKCQIDLVASAERLALGVTDLGEPTQTVVVVVHGFDRDQVMGCFARPDLADKVTVKDGVAIAAENGAATAALTFVDRKIAVALIKQGATAAELRAVLQTGVPLRKSNGFLGFLGQVKQKSSGWLVVNGSAKALGELGQFGLHPRAIIAWVELSTDLVAEVRLPLENVDAATRFVGLMQGQAGMARAMFDDLAFANDGATAKINARLSEPKLLQLMAMTGL